MTRIRQAWKAVLAFVAPGVALSLEPLLTTADFTRETLTRALIVAGVTSVLVYLKTNGPSVDPTTSTPDPVLDLGRALLGTLGVALLVAAGVLAVTTLLGLLVVVPGVIVGIGLLGIVLLLLDGGA